MSAHIAVCEGGLQATVVDRGRFGRRADGVASGGPLDRLAFETANALAGNEPGAAAVEAVFGNLAVRFECDVRFALAGADCAADLDGARVDAWASYEAPRGATLTLHAPRSGARSYLAVAGGIDVPVVLGSRTTNVLAAFGGFEGRALRCGDRLPVGARARREFARGARARCKPPQWDFAAPAFATAEMPLRLLPAGDFVRLSPAQRDRFFANVYTVSPNSDRMGMRLVDAEPVAFDAVERRSHAVFPGVVQLPPGGRPIVLLADAQTTGGYPTLGAVIEADLWKAAQLRPGSRARFVACTPAQAAQARREIVAYLRRVEGSLP